MTTNPQDRELRTAPRTRRLHRASALAATVVALAAAGVVVPAGVASAAAVVSISPSAKDNGSAPSLLTFTGATTTVYSTGSAVDLTYDGPGTSTQTDPTFPADTTQTTGAGTKLVVKGTYALLDPGTYDADMESSGMAAPTDDTCTKCFTISSLAPTAGPIAPAAYGVGASKIAFTLSGTAFANSTTVVDKAASGGVTVATVKTVSATSITGTITVPAGATVGTHTLTVANTDGQSTTIPIAVTPAPLLGAPTASVPNGSSAFPVTLHGVGLQAGVVLSAPAMSGVTFGTTKAAADGQSLTTTVTTGTLTMAGTAVAVTATNTDGGTATSTAGGTASDALRISAAAPTVTSIAPTSVVAGDSATTLAIKGTGFANDAMPSFTGATTADFTMGTATFVSATEVDVTVTPAVSHALAAYDVVVTNVKDQTKGTLSQGFTLLPYSITALSPNSASTAATTATTITLTGKHFGTMPGVFTVTFTPPSGVAGQPAITVTPTAATDTTLTIAPTFNLAAITTYAVTVTDSSGRSYTMASAFTTTGAAPTLNSAAAKMVPGQRSALTLTGTNFTRGTAVTFSDAGLTAGSVTVIDAKTMTVVVTVAGSDAIGTFSDITITDASGATATQKKQITIVAAPTLSASPPTVLTAGGPAGTGSSSITNAGTGATFSAVRTDVVLSGVTGLTPSLVHLKVGGTAVTLTSGAAVGSLVGTLGAASGAALAAPASATTTYTLQLDQGVGKGSLAVTETLGDVDATVTRTDSLATAAGSTTVTTPPAAPAAPTAVQAGAGALKVSFTPPGDNGGTAITGYQVTAVPAGGGAAVVVTGAGSPLTVTGLVPGVTYTITVAASNSTAAPMTYGTSSAPVSAVAAGPPGQPGTPSLAAGDASAVVSFAAAAANGSPVSGYTVTATPTGGGTVVTATGAASPITLTGLVNGVTYTVTVTATNAIGSATSTASSVTAVAPPASAAVTLAISSTFVTSGRPVTLSGALTGGSIATSTVPVVFTETYVDGKSVVIGSATTDANGGYTTTLVPVYNGSIVATALGAASQPVLSKVIVIFNRLTATVDRGKVVINASTAPGFLTAPNRQERAQILMVDGNGKVLKVLAVVNAAQRTGAAGQLHGANVIRYTATLKPGSYHFVVKVLGTPVNTGAASNSTGTVVVKALTAASRAF